MLFRGTPAPALPWRNSSALLALLILVAGLLFFARPRSPLLEPEEARYAARRQFGNPTRFSEQSHEVVGFRLETVLQDIRFALRQLRRNPGFGVLAILILALGMGASS